MTDPVVVIGAGLAGWRVADGIAQHAPDRDIVVIGDEHVPPYDRPPLSKQALLGVRPFEDLTLGRSSDGGRIDLRLGVRAEAVSSAVVRLSTGEQIVASDVVWATGVAPIAPAWVPEVNNVHLLRTISDSRRLGAALVPGSSVIVIGGGFIGCEIAAAAISKGVQVTLIELADNLLAGAVHSDVSDMVRALHLENGVDVRTAEQVTGVLSTASGMIVRTNEGEYRADAVVVGVGARADLSRIGDLPTALGGIACDEHGRVEGHLNTWAVGDVATWRDPVLGESRRREHWTTASTQASIVALGIAGLDVPDALLVQPPYAWSDQYDVKIQILGWPDAGERGEWLEKDGRTGALGYFCGDALAGVMTVGAPRLLMKHRGSINGFAQSRLSPA